jgi:AcrR family transcriptional regulator
MNATKTARSDRQATSPRKARRADAGSTTIRRRILHSAVTLLIDQGCARTTTLQVQQRAGVTRGALLHHFPTHAALLAATVEQLICHNQESVRESLARLRTTSDPTERAIRVLAIATTRPAYMAELELWAVARTDPDLRAMLLLAERKARKDSERVVQALFNTTADRPAQAAVVAMTLEFLRGLALSSVLRSPVKRQQLIAQWVRAARILLDTPST